MLDIIFLRSLIEIRISYAVVDLLVLVLPIMAMLIISFQQPWISWQVRVRNIMFQMPFLGRSSFTEILLIILRPVMIKVSFSTIEVSETTPRVLTFVMTLAKPHPRTRDPLFHFNRPFGA